MGMARLSKASVVSPISLCEVPTACPLTGSLIWRQATICVCLDQLVGLVHAGTRMLYRGPSIDEVLFQDSGNWSHNLFWKNLFGSIGTDFRE